MTWMSRFPLTSVDGDSVARFGSPSHAVHRGDTKRAIFPPFPLKEQSAKYVNETPLKPPFPKGVTIWIWRFGSKRGFANSAKCTYRCFLIIKYPRILIHVKL